MRIDRTKFLVLCFTMAPAIIACGGSGENTGGAGADLSSAPGAAAAKSPAAAAAAPPTVTVNKVALQAPSPTCEVSGNAPTVSIPSNKTMESAINAVLAPLGDFKSSALAVGSSCEEGLAFAQTDFEVTANGNGLLSILVTTDAMMTGGAHPNAGASGFTFDLTNGGKVLNLSDVVTADGTTKQVAACVAAARAVELKNNPDPGNPTGEGSLAEGECATDAVVDPQFNLQPQWVATATGIELVTGTDHADGDFITSTAAWKDMIPSGLKNGVVLNFAKAQK